MLHVTSEHVFFSSGMQISVRFARSVGNHVYFSEIMCLTFCEYQNVDSFSVNPNPKSKTDNIPLVFWKRRYDATQCAKFDQLFVLLLECFD